MTENSSSKSQTNSSNSLGGTKEPSSSGMSSETVSGSPELSTTKSEKLSFLNSPEWNEACKAFQEATQEYNKTMETWWENLPFEQQQWAFYNVCRLIYKGDVEERRSYRGVLYDIFGWGPEAYTVGMEARYMELHNLLWDAREYHELQDSLKHIDQINQELHDAAEYDRSQT